MLEDQKRMPARSVLFSLFLGVAFLPARAQPEDVKPNLPKNHPVVDQVERGIAHDPSWDKPYVRTEADDDPDVAMRPGLRRALAKNRIGGMYSEFNQGFSLQHLFSREEIPDAAKNALRDRWKLVIAPNHLPKDETHIEWRGRNEYPTAPDQNTLAARWSSPAGTFIAQAKSLYRAISLCLQLSGDDRISFRFRAPHEGAEARRREDMVPQDILDKPRLLEILTTYFRFPFETVKDFQVISGPSGVYEGVRIFTGDIRWSRSRLVDQPELARIGRESSEYNEARLFITDSEPQYFCIGVTLDEAEK